MIKSYPKRKPLRLKGKALRDLYQSVRDRDNNSCRCPFCEGNSPIDSAPHHIIYKSQGGPDEAWNLITLCMSCHDKIHNRGTLKVRVRANSEDKEIKWIEKSVGTGPAGAYAKM